MWPTSSTIVFRFLTTPATTNPNLAVLVPAMANLIVLASESLESGRLSASGRGFFHRWLAGGAGTLACVTGRCRENDRYDE